MKSASGSATTRELDVCLAHNAERPPEQRVPEDVLRLQHRTARTARELLPREEWDEIHHIHTA
ncbi:hypothetical protein [Kitasatospora sp. DSM 101779]|uniref:hypothetical protein n=1 Tax=Kitasatospora sp. DSM 101779 TaxID=2853165 RepID=UPI0021D8CB91|nr:hypothetical protein [Kitasatospora sp. DSM 101779]MCU7827231.1 hypothetical protein [Kitasatospora sp. DSM 101779]